ncbi:hypothetical protein GGF32_007066 [Allomyces javanicus]|nr:hypothetical protein GGF32_007066 [Allomyces javanicus]
MTAQANLSPGPGAIAAAGTGAQLPAVPRVDASIFPDPARPRVPGNGVPPTALANVGSAPAPVFSAEKDRCQAWIAPGFGTDDHALWITGCFWTPAGYQCQSDPRVTLAPSCSMGDGWNPDCAPTDWLYPVNATAGTLVRVHGCVGTANSQTTFQCLPASALSTGEEPASAPPMKCATKVEAACKDALITQAAVLKAARDGDKVDKDAVATLTAMIAEHTANTVSRDTLLAHTVLLAAFHHQLRGEAKNFAFLCTAETRYLAFMDALAKAVLSPIRYADDMQRCYGNQMLDIDFPLLRMANAISDNKNNNSNNKDDVETGRAFWAAHMPADMPYDQTPALVDETKATATAICPTCQAEETMDMAEYASFRLNAKEHMCVSCACEFTAEHVAVDWFLALAARTSAMHLAGTQTHPKTQMPACNDRANIADIAALFAKDEWAAIAAAAVVALPLVTPRATQ